MTLPSSAVIIVVVLAFAFYLMYSQQNQQYLSPHQLSMMKSGFPGCKCQQHQQQSQQPGSPQYPPTSPGQPSQQPTMLAYPPQPPVNVMIDRNDDPYSDPIKKQDLYTMYDPLTYPQLRLPREVLDRYNEYYERTGTYPPFNMATQPSLFDNPVLNGLLIKVVDENEPFSDNVPFSIPLFRVKSAKNANRFFYYVIDQRYLSKVEPKIPLDNVKVNGTRYHNVDFYGIPELFDGDVVEHISIYPGAKFKVTLYKTYHFP
jgi:hypothetical protein